MFERLWLSDTAVGVLEGVRPIEQKGGGGLPGASYLHRTRPPSGASFCGDGRGRTAVRTPHQAAFYTLILPLFVGNGLPTGGRTDPYPLNLGAV